MSIKANAIVRATAACRVVQGKKDPSKQYGFQTFGLQTETGMWKEFDMMFDPSKGSHFLPPGDYEVVASGAYLDRDNRLQVGREFVPVKAASKAA